MDASFFVDPRFNPYFGPVDAGDGSATAGQGTGEGFLDWSQLPPEFLAALNASIGDRYGVSGGSGGQSMRDFLSQGGFHLYDQPLGQGKYQRGVVGPDGQLVAPLQEVADSNDDAFGIASILAGALTGANVLGAQSALAGAGEAGIGTLGTLPNAAAPMAPIAASGAAPLTTAGLMGGGATLPAVGAGVAGGAASAAGAAGAGSVLDTLKGAAGGAADFLKENKWAMPVLGGLLGGMDKPQGGYSYSGPMPTMSTEGWSPTAKPQMMSPTPQGLLNTAGMQGQANSGLLRFLKG